MLTVGFDDLILATQVCLAEVEHDGDEAARLHVDSGIRLVIGRDVLRIQCHAESGDRNLSQGQLVILSCRRV